MPDENDGKPPEKDVPAEKSDEKADAAVDSGWEDESEKKDEPKAEASEKPNADEPAPEPKAETPVEKKPDPADDPGKSPEGEKKSEPADADEKKSEPADADEKKSEPDGDKKSVDEKPDDDKKSVDEDDDGDDKKSVDEKPDDDKKSVDEDDDGDDKKSVDDKAESEADKAVAADADEDEPKPSARAKAPERKAAAWGRPLARLDRAWTTWEVWLCTITVVLEVLVLTLWVGLKGLSTEIDGSSKAGLVFRALTGAVVLGTVGYLVLKRKSLMAGRIGGIVGMLAGIFLARAWGNFAVEWSGNLLNWYQQASFLTLLGGLRGVGTRLTLLLALLGGSLATAAGKHITIDLATRYMKPALRLPVVLCGWVAASAICFSAAWGFFDHIAIDDFGAKAEMRAGEKLSHVGSGISENWFIAKKQIGLDFKSFPHVVKGERYSEWMSAAEWNAWVESAGFVERYGREKTDLLRVGDDVNRAPIVLIPEKGEPRGELSKAANLVFPIGLFIISLRFILLALLALSGHKTVDPDAAHEMGFGDTKPKTEPEPEGGEAK
jgi:hypothetical protein